MAAGLGLEPRQTESESVVLPLHNPASCMQIIVLHLLKCQDFCVDTAVNCAILKPVEKREEVHNVVTKNQR